MYVCLHIAIHVYCSQVKKAFHSYHFTPARPFALHWNALMVRELAQIASAYSQRGRFRGQVPASQRFRAAAAWASCAD